MAGERFGQQQTPGVLAVKKGGTGLGDIPAGSVLVANNLDVFTCATSVAGIWVLRNDNGTISWGDLSNLDIDTHTLDDHLDVEIAGSWGGAGTGYPLVADRDLLYYDNAAKLFVSGDYSAAGFGYASQLCVDNPTDVGCLVRLDATNTFPYVYLPEFIGSDGVTAGLSKKGAVPAAATADTAAKFLDATGVWSVPSGTSGEANTSSNVGGFAGLALPKSVLDLPFKTLQSSDATLTITQNAQDIDLTISASNINQALTFGNGLNASAATYDGSAAVSLAADYELVTLPAKAATPASLGVATTLSRSDHVHLVNDLGDIADVNLAGLADLDVLQYQLATADWQNVALGAIFEPIVTWRDGLVNAAGISDVDYNATNLKIDGGAGSGGALNTIQDIDATASPTFVGITLSALAGVGNRNIMVDPTGAIVIDATGTGYWTRNVGGYLYPTTSTDDVGIAITDAPQTELEVGGDISLTEDVDRSISVLTSSGATVGGDLTLQAGTAGAGVGNYAGGNLILKSGAGGGSGGANNSGLISIYANTGDTVGDVYLNRNELGVAIGDTYLGNVDTDLTASDVLLIDATGKIVKDGKTSIMQFLWTRNVAGWMYPTNIGEPVGIGALFTGLPAEALEVTGNIALSKNANREIYNVARDTAGIGYILGLQAGDAFSAGADYKGGALTLEGGDGAGTNYDGGDVHLMGGSGGGTGAFGSIYLNRGLGPGFTALGSTYIGEVAQDLVSTRILVYDSATGLIGYDTRTNINSTIDEFTELIDTPANYTGSAGYLIQVNGVPNGLEFTEHVNEDQHGTLSNSLSIGIAADADLLHPVFTVTEAGFVPPWTLPVLPDDVILGVTGWTTLSELMTDPLTFNWRAGLAGTVVSDIMTVDVDYDPLNLDMTVPGDTGKLTTIQDIHTTSSPEFTGLTLNGFAPGDVGKFLEISAGGVIIAGTPAGGGTYWAVDGSDNLYNTGHTGYVDFQSWTRHNPYTADDSSVYIGLYSGIATLTGTANVMVGHYVGASLTTGSDNIGLGYQALQFATSSSDNIAIGTQALNVNTVGINNVAIGTEALSENDDNDENVAIGYHAMRYELATGYNKECVAVGAYALMGVTGVSSGTSQTAIGWYALGRNTTGNQNTAVGHESLGNNTTGLRNTALGLTSAAANTTGDDNVAVGVGALYSNVGNNKTIAIGYQAMYYADDRIASRDTYNIAIGYQALMGSITAANNIGRYNTVVGYEAAKDVTSGNYITAFGYNALSSNTSGSYNVAIGHSALLDSTTGVNNTAVGGQAGSNITGYSNVLLGYSAGLADVAGFENWNECVFVGVNAGYNNGASSNVGIGHAALTGDSVLAITGTNNVGVGKNTLFSLQSGTGNVAVGLNAGYDLTTGDECIFIGSAAGTNVTTSDSLIAIGHSALETYVSGTSTLIAIGYEALKNVTASSGGHDLAIGYQALLERTTGVGGNTAVGGFALKNNTTSQWNTAVGYNAGAGIASSTWSYSTFMGTAAGQYNDGSNNTGIGYNALRGAVAGLTGYNNVAVGVGVGAAMTSGFQNTMVGDSVCPVLTSGFGNSVFGYYAGNDLTTGDYNVLLGYRAGESLTTENSQLYISSRNASNNVVDLLQGDFDRNNSDDTGRVTINDVLLLPQRSGAPNIPVNGEIWTESDGVHVYIGGSEYTLDMT